MGIFNFKSQSQKEKETLAKNLIAVMLSDGQIDQDELKYLGMVCARHGITEKQLQDILKKPQNIKFTPPKDPNNRMQQLVDIVFMMLADGQIDEREMDTCMTLATHLGFRPSAVRDLVQHLIAEAKKNQQTKQVNVNLDDYILIIPTQGWRINREIRSRRNLVFG